MNRRITILVTALAVLLIAVLALVPLAGCQTLGRVFKGRQAKGLKVVAADPNRDTASAEKHNTKATEALQRNDLTEAEKECKAALADDALYGPAHNNLGVVYHRQKKYYLAAWEYQYAAKVMPDKAQPRNNLGQVFELVGQLPEAIESYEEAAELSPDDAVIAGNLARALVRSGKTDDRTRHLLEEVVIKDTRPAWVEWARKCLALMGPAGSRQPEPAPITALEKPATEKPPSDAPPPDLPPGPPDPPPPPPSTAPRPGGAGPSDAPPDPAKPMPPIRDK
ncbi:MAG: tetratricopeptide repeat protein [Planctomycetes bacterium]|nr:tetratricopeptide repeat protein [Planctomycetota bacterium]